MRSKTRRVAARHMLFSIVGGASVTVLLLLFFLGNPRTPTPKNVAQNAPMSQTAITSSQTYGLPVRLIIPKIKVDAPISFMGLTRSGNMEAPITNEDAGWYKYGPHPGDIGSAVIAGHLGVSSRAVFTELSLLEKGDIVSVKDDRSRIVSFVVRETRTYEYNTEPSEVFRSSTGAHLNLITCNGDYDTGQKTYTRRLVVFTDKI